MKRILLITCCLISLGSMAQDTIFTKLGDTILGKVAIISPTHFNYMGIDGNSRMIPRKAVSRYYLSSDIKIMKEDLSYVLEQAPNPNDITADFTSGSIQYNAILYFNGLSQEDIYKKARLWIVNNYVNPEKVISADITNENIVVNGYCDRCMGISGATYRLQFDFKEGKCRLNFAVFKATDLHGYTEISIYKMNGDLRTDKYFKGIIHALDNEVNRNIYSIQSYIIGSNNDDW